MIVFCYDNNIISAAPDPPFIYPTYTSLGVILGATFGSLGFVGLLAFVVYLVKYRNMDTSCK